MTNMRVATEEFFFCYVVLLLLNWSWSCSFGLGLSLGLHNFVLFPSLVAYFTLRRFSIKLARTHMNN